MLSRHTLRWLIHLENKESIFKFLFVFFQYRLLIKILLFLKDDCSCLFALKENMVDNDWKDLMFDRKAVIFFLSVDLFLKHLPYYLLNVFLLLKEKWIFKSGFGPGLLVYNTSKVNRKHTTISLRTCKLVFLNLKVEAKICKSPTMKGNTLILAHIDERVIVETISVQEQRVRVDFVIWSIVLGKVEVENMHRSFFLEFVLG